MNRITKSLQENIIANRYSKQAVINIPLLDIDELSFKGEGIYCIGGQIGQAMIILDQILRTLAENNTITNDSVKIPEFIEKFLEEFLLNQIKENIFLELRYLESAKYDFKDIPFEEAKRREFHEFMLDDRRFVNKSVKFLLEKGLLTEYVYRSFLEAIAKIYLFQPVDPSSIEVDPSNQDESYLESIDKMKTTMELQNRTMKKMKSRIKLEFVNPEDLKKKRDNIGGFLTVHSTKQVYESLIEIEEPPVDNLNNKNIQETNENLNRVHGENAEKDVTGNNLEQNIHVDKESSNEDPKINNLNNEIIEPIRIKVEYLNEVELFKNSIIPIDSYILHFNLTEGYIAYTVRSIRRVLKKNYEVIIDLNESFNSLKEKIYQISSSVFDQVIKHEKYKGKSIIHLDVKPEIPPENPEMILD